MNCDSYFSIGKSHIVCEDYAFSGVNTKGNNVIIVSDGCSGSENTDFGSRFLVRSAFVSRDNTIDLESKENFDYFLIRDSIHHANVLSQIAKLPENCLDATLLYAEIIDKTAFITVAGDGFVFAKTNSGIIKVWMIEYPSGCPFYPSYFLNEKRLNSYRLNIGNKRLVDSFDINTEGNIENRQKIICEEDFFSLCLCPEKYEFIGIASDGLLTFDLPIEKVITEITAFKNYTGEFVKRRIKKFLKSCVINDKLPYDDVSVAVIHLKD